MNEHDLVVIGAGPGGYVAAIRAAQLGLNVACVEQESALGGTCLRVGCIPSKALLESSFLYTEARHHFEEHGIRIENCSLDLAAMLERKDRVVQFLTKGVEALFRKNRITRYQGRGRLAGPGHVIVDGDQPAELRAKHIILATGSKPAPLRGVEFDGDFIGGSTEALNYQQVPGRLVVIGGGYIGLELGSVWSRLGSQVTVLEYLDRILAGIDTEVAREAHKLFEKQGLEFRLGARVTAARRAGDHCVVEYEGADPIECDRVLVCTGRVPNTDNLNLPAVGVQADDRGRILVDNHFRTSAEGVYALGDVIPGPMLAHKAEDEGVACAEFIATGYGHVNYDTIPAVVYTEPEIASVGKTEDELKQSGRNYRKGAFPFRINGRARGLGQTDGFVKVLADADTDRILGVHIIGPRAGDLIAEAAVAMEFGASSEDLARCCHAHPTLAEVLKEASMAVAGRAIHS